MKGSLVLFSTSLCALLSVVPIIEAASKSFTQQWWPQDSDSAESSSCFIMQITLTALLWKKNKKGKTLSDSSSSTKTTGDDKWILLLKNIYFWGRTELISAPFQPNVFVILSTIPHYFRSSAATSKFLPLMKKTKAITLASKVTFK